MLGIGGPRYGRPKALAIKDIRTPKKLQKTVQKLYAKHWEEDVSTKRGQVFLEPKQKPLV